MSAEKLFGVVAPHPPILLESVGGARSAATSDTARAMAEAGGLLAAFAPETLVLMSPHAPFSAGSVLVNDCSHVGGSLAQFGDPTRVTASGDPELATAIVSACLARDVAASPTSAVRSIECSSALDHGTLVPLRALRLPRLPALVVMSISAASLNEHKLVGEAVREAARRLGRRTAFIASGDLSHRLTPDAPAGYDPSGAVYDRKVVEALRDGRMDALVDFDDDLIDAAGQCGMRSMVALCGFLGDQCGVSRVLSYEGPWGVGYLTAVAGEGCLADTPPAGDLGGMPGDEEHEIVALARAAVTLAAGGKGTLRDPHLTDPALPQRAGAFVSLHRGGELRGCIGTIGPTQADLAEEIAHNAVSAALHDPRFPALRESELADLDISVDVLGTPEPCTLADLDPARYGVIVSSGGLRGLLLPDLEGVDTVQDQVAIALRKAGLTPNAPYRLERFTVHRYT
jgi:AmmeMemoRadiSam system protein A